MRPESIAAAARRSISRYCAQECGAYCCRKGTLIVRGAQVPLVTQGAQAELEAQGRLHRREDGSYALSLAGGCPSLEGVHCMIHAHRGRPPQCRQFPLFLNEGRIRLAYACPAVERGLLYPFVRRLLAAGCTLEQDEPVRLACPPIEVPERG